MALKETRSYRLNESYMDECTRETLKEEKILLCIKTASHRIVRKVRVSSVQTEKKKLFDVMNKEEATWPITGVCFIDDNDSDQCRSIKAS